ncbi:histone H2A.Z-like [Mustela nigripes]|uniref:histone H2A.Z-like n=1 Tax=Mustela nigripes TaxID=77151 RepID=UPI002814A8D1|nr:histone H2A.Z-like [Mustela nigripes]
MQRQTPEFKVAGGKAGKNSGKAKKKAVPLTQSQPALPEGLCWAGKASQDLKVTPLALCGEEEAASLTKATGGGGVTPHSHKSLPGEKGRQKTV